MDAEVRKILLGKKEQVERTIEKRKKLHEWEIFKYKLKVCDKAKNNSIKLNDILFERFITSFVEQYTLSQNELSTDIKSLFDNREFYKLGLDEGAQNREQIQAFNPFAIDYNICKDYEELSVFYRKGAKIPFVLEKKLFDYLGIKMKESPEWNTIFYVDSVEFRNKIESIVNGEIEVEIERYVVLKTAYEEILERESIINRFNEMSKKNAEIIYLWIHKYIAELFNSKYSIEDDMEYDCSLDCIKYKNGEEYEFSNDILKAYKELGIYPYENIMFVKIPDDDEGKYLIIKSSDFKMLIENDDFVTIKVSDKGISFHSSQCRIEEVILNMEEEKQQELTLN